MQCPNCGNENRKDAKFCDECGVSLAPAPEGDTSSLAAHSDKVSDSIDDQGASASGSEEDNAKPGSQPVPDDIKENGEDETEPTGSDDEGEKTGGDEPAKSNPSSTENEDVAVSPTDDTAAILIHDDEPLDKQQTRAFPPDLTGFARSADPYGETFIDADYEDSVVDYRDGGTVKMPRVETEEEPASRDYLASSAEKKPEIKTKVVLVVVVLALVALIVGLVTYQMQLWGGKAIPDVVGMTQADATSVLEENGFSVRASQVKSDETEGLVLVMDPTFGARAEEGSEVVIHIATGRQIPDIVGKTRDEATAALEAEGFENVKFETERSDMPENSVLSISPEPGQRAKSTADVVVKVAEPFVVPDVAGMYLDAAQQSIADAGLTSEVVYIYTEAYTDGVIIGTEPVAGSKVAGSTIVQIQIARSRATEVVALTQSYLAPGATVNIGMFSYQIQSLNSVEYLGNDTVAYSATARPYMSAFGETAYFAPQALSGQVVWTSGNQIASIS